MNEADRLQRFVCAQDHAGIYEAAVAELRPGVSAATGCGSCFRRSRASVRVRCPGGIRSRRSTRPERTWPHPVLGARLIECTRIVSELHGCAAEDVLGSTDAMKLRSSMTLFAHADPGNRLFRRVLEAYFGGAPDEATERLLTG